MSLAKVAAFASLVGALSFAVGCAAPVAEETTEQSESNLSTGTFKLYEDDATAADSQCDSHTELTLSLDRTPSGLRASLRNVVDGTCRILVDPAARDFRLEITAESCGSKIYKGTETVAGEKHEITITDNRSRLCRDVVPAVVVEENLGGERRLLQAL
jgi:hypothetical protein